MKNKKYGTNKCTFEVCKLKKNQTKKNKKVEQFEFVSYSRRIVSVGRIS